MSLSKTAKDGSSYFSEDDGYYAAPPGASRWHGIGAEKGLGLFGEVHKIELDAVLRGYNPRTGEKLVANADAEDILGDDGKVIKKGRVAYIDVHAAVPKSASILALIDPRIELAHNLAIERIIAYLEAEYAFTRCEKSGTMQTVKSDNLVIARINHYESRDLDPQLHSHLVVMNLTCGEDKKWRSICAGKIYQDQQCLGQIYRNELAKEIKKVGYAIEVTDPDKGLFEIKGVETGIIEKYSKRRKAIEKKLEEYKKDGIYEKLSNRDKSQKACLATRRKKQKVKPEKIREMLEAELAETGLSLASVREVACQHGQSAVQEPPRTAEECVRSAINDVMDKQAAATEAAIIGRALKGGMGYYTADQLAVVLRGQRDWETLGPGVGDKYHTTYYTTTETRLAEQRVVDYAKRDRGQYGRAISAATMDAHMARIAAEGKTLSTGQYAAVKMVCTARDRVSLIQGDAGAGKTFAMETVKEILATEGICVRGFAPTGKAADELTAVGVKAQTIHSYLESPNAQAEAGQGEVWLVDEAGMVGIKRLNDFLKKAAEKQARVILIGDDKQFQSVEQGKMFQTLQDMRVVQKAEITEVKRQKTKHAKAIVSAIKSKDYETAFCILDQQNSLKEIASRDEQIKYIVNEYVADAKNGTKSVVLTATNADKDEINNKIRASLAASGKVQTGEPFEMYRKNDMNSITKTFGRAYRDGQIIITRRDCAGIPRGTQATIAKIDTDNDIISVKFYNKKTAQHDYVDIDLHRESGKIEVYDRAQKRFGVGDSIIFTKNDKAVGVSNGQTGTVIGIDTDGNAQISVGKKTIECNLNNRGAKGYTYIDHAYCLTNHKSQGSTYDKVIVNANVSRQKTSYNAFYVQATRAKYDIVIVTDDKAKLAEQAAIRENKISTLDAVFEEYAQKQQERAADIRAESTEFDEIAEKAKNDRILDRVKADLAATTIPLSRAAGWQDTEDSWKYLTTLQAMRYSNRDELKKKYIEQHQWARFDPPSRDRNGNYIVACLLNQQKPNNAKYITAQPHENGEITYWASIGKLQETDKIDNAVSYKNISDAKTIIEIMAVNGFLAKTVDTVKSAQEQLAKEQKKTKSTSNNEFSL